jgi:hypothetical protein
MTVNELEDWQQDAWAAYAALRAGTAAEIQLILDELTEDIRRATGQDGIRMHLDVTPIQAKVDP